MTYRPVHHVLNIVVILHSGFASLRQGHWFGESVVMVIMVLGSLAIGCFQVRRRALELARRRHGHWRGTVEDEAIQDERQLVAQEALGHVFDT